MGRLVVVPVLLAAALAMPAAAQPVVGNEQDLWAAGTGAIAGVVAFNILTAPFGIVPLAGGALAAVPTSVALGSRLIAVTTAAGGALAATWAYDQWTGGRSDYHYILALGAGALAGVAAGNYLSAGFLGRPPLAAGAGIANAAGGWASAAAQASSRIYAVGSGVLGAWSADWLYRRNAVQAAN